MKKEIWKWTKAIVIAIILAFLLRTFVFATSIVEGTSMNPTLHNGERVIFNKAVYLIGSPDRGDIVIIQHPHKNYVKRIIGLPMKLSKVKIMKYISMAKNLKNLIYQKNKKWRQAILAQ